MADALKRFQADAILKQIKARLDQAVESPIDFDGREMWWLAAEYCETAHPPIVSDKAYQKHLRRVFEAKRNKFNAERRDKP